MSNGDCSSMRAACKALNVDHSLAVRWKKKEAALKAKLNQRAKSTHAGPPSILQQNETELLRFIFELREQGIAVKTENVMHKACSLNRELKEKSRVARMNVTR